MCVIRAHLGLVILGFLRKCGRRRLSYWIGSRRRGQVEGWLRKNKNKEGFVWTSKRQLEGRPRRNKYKEGVV